ncbi:IS3 family transposase [Gottfriedia endophytica]|uniref:IS3 family transposase n=1 Tax=Gottfriedia endophytica TaxID=2820819 RepID=UPI0038994EED
MFNHKRIKAKLYGMSSVQYRKSCQYKVAEISCLTFLDSAHIDQRNVLFYYPL